MANDKLKQALREAAQKEYFDITCESAQWEPSERFCAKTEPVIKNNNSRTRTVFRRIVPIAAVMLLLASTMLFSMADVREKVINYFESNRKDHIDLKYGFDEAGDISPEDVLNDILMPDFESKGFTLKKQELTDHSSVTVWEKGQQVVILQQGDGLTNRSVDAERLVKNSKTVRGVSFDIYSEEGYYLILWTTDKYTFSLDCYCDIEQTEIIDMILSCREAESEEAQ